MAICYHCGKDITELLMCSECGQQYCSLHIDPVTHECNLFKEAKNQQLTSESFQNFSLQTSYEGNRNQCWFCGLSFQETFNCNNCNQKYCELHIELNNHDCPSLFDFSTQPLPRPLRDTEIPLEIPTPSYLQREGRIELDTVIIENSVKDLINSCIEFAPDNEFKEFVKSNPSGLDLVDKLKLFRDHPLIESIFIWLSGISSSPINAMPYITNNNIDLHSLILDRYLHLFDSSHLDNISGVDPLTGGITDTKINSTESLNVTKRLLTYISEHARKVKGFECIGYLKGKRSSDFKIAEVNGYIPMGHGSRTMVNVSFDDLIKIINELKEKENTIVGWYHSHPKRGAPSYSESDKKSHLMFRNMLSILNHIKELKIKVPKDRFYHVLSLISSFKHNQIEYLLGIILDYVKKPKEFLGLDLFINNFFLNIQKKYGYDQAAFNGSVSLSTEKFLQYQQEISNSFELMKNNIVSPSLTVNLELIPLAGMVICPENRYIAVIDEKSSQDSEQWVYYKINTKEEN